MEAYHILSTAPFVESKTAQANRLDGYLRSELQGCHVTSRRSRSRSRTPVRIARRIILCLSSALGLVFAPFFSPVCCVSRVAFVSRWHACRDGWIARGGGRGGSGRGGCARLSYLPIYSLDLDGCVYPPWASVCGGWMIDLGKRGNTGNQTEGSTRHTGDAR